MTLLVCFFDDVLIVAVAVSIVYGVKTTVSLFADFHPYLLSLIYPQIGRESDTLFLVCCFSSLVS